MTVSADDQRRPRRRSVSWLVYLVVGFAVLSVMPFFPDAVNLVCWAGLQIGGAAVAAHRLLRRPRLSRMWRLPALALVCAGLGGVCVVAAAFGVLPIAPNGLVNVLY